MVEVEASLDGPIRELPLREIHKALGAKFVSFAGWNMPVQYSGLAHEHESVRSGVGIFDVSHMGQLMLEGVGAEGLLQLISTNDISKLVDGKAQYGLMLNKLGGVVDDIIVYRINEHKYFVCVNASNTEGDYQWFLKHKGDFDCTIKNLSPQYMQFAVQGPLAMNFLAEVFGDDARELKRFAFRTLSEYSVLEVPCIMARTGYSGEDGVEVFVPMEKGEEVWNALFAKANELNVNLVPCGLGARDTLRIEANLPLHGHEIKEEITPLRGRKT
jgi:aminomethyltransferase